MLSIVARWKPCKCGRGGRPLGAWRKEACRVLARRGARPGCELGRVRAASAGLQFSRESCHSCHSCHFKPLISYMTKSARPVSGMVEWGNLRLNSLMFAYVRLIGEKFFEGAAPRHQLSFDNPPRPADTRVMIELEQACQRILAVLAPLPPEPIALDAAVGRVAAEPILSPIDLPPFDNSAMDGYAVSAADLRSARAEAPVKLELLGQVAAGQAFAGKVRPGTCV